METITANYLFYILAIAGVLMHIGLKFRDFVSKYPKDFNLKNMLAEWGWKKHLFFGFFSLMMALILIYTWDYWLESTFPMNTLNAFFIGYFADSIFKNLKTEKQKQLNVNE